MKKYIYRFFALFFVLFSIYGMSKSPEKNNQYIKNNYKLTDKEIKFIENNLDLMKNLNLYQNLEVFTNTSKEDTK